MAKRNRPGKRERERARPHETPRGLIPDRLRSEVLERELERRRERRSP
jgi:hypothetical protein